MTQGFSCSKCLTDDIPVVQTMTGKGFIHRRRKCPTCDKLHHTYEIPAELIPSEAEFDFLFRKDLR